jgi:hypothetical protein
MVDIALPVRPDPVVKGQPRTSSAHIEQKQLDDIAAKTSEKLKGTFGVDALKLDEPGRRTIREPAFDVQVDEELAKSPDPAAQAKSTHRFTVTVPNTEDYAVLNLGQGKMGPVQPHDTMDSGLVGHAERHLHFYAK